MVLGGISAYCIPSDKIATDGPDECGRPDGLCVFYPAPSKETSFTQHC